MPPERVDNSGHFDSKGTQFVGNPFNNSGDVNVGASHTDLAIQEQHNVYGQSCGDTIVGDRGRLWQGNHYGPQVNHYYSAPQTALKDKDKCRILLESLTFDRMDARLRNIATASPNTCQWVQRHECFLAWADPSRVQEHGDFLWIKGKPGAGKSTIMKTLLAWAEKNWSTELILTYFFNARSPSELEKSSLGLYRSLVYQILVTDPHSQARFVRVFASKERNGKVVEEWTQTELQNFLTEVVMNGRQRSVNLFIDALDEGQDSDVRQMVGYLEHLVYSVAPTGICLRICLASRHYPHITVRKNLTITLEDQMEHERDIDRYIDIKLLVEHNQQRDVLRDQVRHRSAGVFLWVTLVVSQLNQLWDRGRSIRNMLGIIEETPRYLPDLFQTTFARDLEDIDESLTFLRWVLFARRPLRPIELYIAVQSSCGVIIDDANFPSDGAIGRHITDCSRGLLQITTSEPPTVQFIHETVREFLINKSGASKQHLTEHGSMIIPHSFRAEECHMTIAEECLQYVIHLAREKLSTDTEQLELAQYVAEQWWQHVHASKLACGPKVLKLAYELLKTDGALLFWLKCCDRDDSPLCLSEAHMDNLASPLYYAAAIGMTELVRMLLDQGAGVDERRTRGDSTALQAASMGGYLQTIQLLLDCGADVNAEGGEFGSALLEASERGHVQVVQLLLDVGADVNAKRAVSTPTAIHGASRGGHVEIVKMLLKAGANVNVEGGSFGTALQAAAAAGSKEIVQMLLDAGANVNAQGGIYGTALGTAIRNDRVQVVHTLLESGADIAAEDFYFSHAMQTACEGGNVQIVQLLVEHNADVNAAVGKPPMTPLHTACNEGHLQVVQALLRAGADVNAESKVYIAPIHMASRNNSIKLVRILLDHGANVNSRGGYYGSALQAACAWSSVQLVQTLLDHGADVNAEAGLAGTALEIASERGDKQVCQLLRAYGAKSAQRLSHETLCHE